MKWVIWGLAVFFYFYEYYIRVTPSVITTELMETFNINAGVVGLIAGFYFYAYGPMQLPVGVLTDRFGARNLLTIASFVMGIGGILFAFAQYVIVAEAGRFLLGAGSSFGFVGLVYICTHWFPKQRWALMIGLGNSVGMMGAVLGEGPMSSAVQAFGWRTTVFVIALIGIALGIAMVLILRNGPDLSAVTEDEHNPYFWKQLIVVLKNFKNWLLAFSSFAYNTVASVLGGLWAVPFIQQAYGVGRDTASFASSMIFLGFVVGGPIAGYLSDYFRERRLLLVILTIATGLVLLPIIYYPEMGIVWLYILLFVLGFFGSGQLLTYSYAIDLNPIEVKGSSSAFINTVVYIGAAILQPTIGLFLDWFWDGKLKNGTPAYSTADYQATFTWFPILLFVSAFLLIIMGKNKREPASKQQHHDAIETKIQ